MDEIKQEWVLPRLLHPQSKLGALDPSPYAAATGIEEPSVAAQLQLCGLSHSSWGQPSCLMFVPHLPPLGSWNSKGVSAWANFEGSHGKSVASPSMASRQQLGQRIPSCSSRSKSNFRHGGNNTTDMHRKTNINIEKKRGSKLMSTK